MRVLSENEMATVAGGLLPLNGPGGGGYTPYSGSNPVLSRQDVQQLANESNLNGLLTQNSIYVVNQSEPNSAYGASSIAGNTVYIPPDRSVGYSSGDVLMQIAHELGHQEHPVDLYPTNYLTEGDYATAQLTGEGWAQIQAIQTAASLAPYQDIPQIPGDPTLASEETATYYLGLSNGDSMSQIAQDIGAIMGSQSLTTDWAFGPLMGSNEDYSQWLSNNWDNAWGIGILN